ncbi:DUF11 domain-containing protein [Chitinophaga silvatica]|uniref:DUF11 domain-containing protein n=1 Tax=Chitinophaga silvatica TaxID=2282649 RepID=A0A3E1Y752_9BACT|nr:gliding motility-associated C-terminal domain-containing protein [Chitinophaga silvatica]RFS20718.1 DUF11 domain-containing protein [Chitinophaga silvatica]
MIRHLLGSDNCVRTSKKLLLLTLLLLAGVANAGLRHRAPTAVDDNYNTFRGVPVNANVTANDNANGNGPLTVQTTPVTNVTNGTLVLRADGSFTYTPNNLFFGVDRFSYRVCDKNGACAVGNVLIDVAPARADVVLKQTTNPDTAYVGEPITYTFTFTNNGPSPVYSNEVWYLVEQVPYGLDVQSLTVNEGTFDPNSRRWTGFDFPPGKTVTATMVGVVRPDYTPNSITNIVTIQPPNNVIVVNVPTSTITTPVVKRTDLSVTKTDGTEFFTPGSQTTYTMVVANSGKVNLQRVLIQDNLPPGINTARWTATTSGGATLPTTSGTGTIFQQAAMPGNSTITFKLAVDIPANYSQQTLINTVTVQTLDENITDPNPGNNTASDTDRIQNNYALNITKTGPASAIAGNQISYQVVFTNTGFSDLKNANFYDTLDSKLTNISYTVATTGSATASVTSGTGSPVHFQGSLPAGGNGTIVLNITGTIATNATGQITNFASGIGPNGKRDVSNTVTTTLQAKTGLNIVKTGPATGTVVAGQPISYTITVTNAGPSDDPAVNINDLVPAVITNVNWTVTANGKSTIATGASSGGSGNSIATTAVMPAGVANSVVINVTGTVLSGATGTITNTATAQSTAGGQVSSSNQTTITSKPTITVVKSGPAQVNAGGVVNYTIVYRNSGPSDANGVLLSDQIPASLSNTSWTATTAGKASVISGITGTGNNIAVVANIPAGDANTITVNISGTISAAFQGAIQNTAIATVPGIPPFTSNTVITNVVNKTSLQITKTGPATATAGGSITYQLFVTNLGPSNAYGVSIKDQLPAQILQPNMTVTSTGGAVITNNNLQNGLLTVTGDIPAGNGNGITITVQGTVDPSFTGSFQNQASAATKNDSVNSNIVVTTALNNAVPAISKTGPATGIAGTIITYNIIAANNGLSDATGMIITDQVPATITNVTYTTTINGKAVVTANPTGSGNNIRVTGNIPAGSGNSIVVNVQGTINKNFTGTILNKATGALTSKPSVSDSVSTVVSRQSAVSISKTSPARIAAGNSITYSLLVINNGPSDAPLVNILDTVPNNLGNVTWVATASNGATILSGTTGAGNLLAITANIPAGSAEVVVKVTGATNPAFAGTLLNTAHAKWDNDSASSGTVTTVVFTSADLNISKIGPATLDAGQGIAYTITANNNGPSTATGVTITDIVPASINAVSWAVTASGAATVDSANSGTGNTIKTKVTIPPGAANIITIRINGTTGTSFVGTLANAANMVLPGQPPVVSDTVKTVVTSRPQLTLTKMGPDTANAGGAIHYVLSWQNKGASDALQAVFTDTLPAQITNVTWSTQPASAAVITAGATGSGNLIKITANLPAGNNNTIQIFVDGIISPSFTGTLKNSATALVINTDTVKSNVVNTVVVNKSGIRISKQGAAQVNSGAPVSFTLLVSNTGPSDATGVQIKDLVPAAVTNVTWSAIPAGTATIASGATGSGNNISVNGTIPAGAGNSITVTINGKLDASYTGTSLKNIATAQANGGSLQQDSAIASVKVTPGIVVIKTAPDSVNAGEPISYGIVVSNTGPATATNLNIGDVIPAGIDNASWTATTSGAGTTVSSSSGTGNINVTANIPADPSATVRFTITGTVNSQFAAGSIRNIATALVNETGTTIADTVTTRIVRDAELTIIKTGPATANAGNAISYQIVVGNTGPSLASQVRITDTIPTGIINPVWTVQTSGGATSSVNNGTGNILLTSDIPVTTGKVIITVNGTIAATQRDTTIINSAVAQLPSGYQDTVAVSSKVQTVISNKVDLVMVKSGPTTKVAGQPIQYQLVVSNNGPADAIAAVVTDTIPAAIGNVSVTATTTGTATVNLQPVAGNRIFAVVNIPVGAGNKVTITVNGVVDPSTPVGTIKNTGYVRPGSGNNVINTFDDSSSVTTQITNQVGVTISKNGPAALNVGDPITYRIDVSNTGVSDANGVVILDTIPAGIISPSYTVSVTGNGGTTFTDLSTTPGIIHLSANIEGTTSGPGTITIIVNGTVSQNAAGSLVNNAHADFGGRNTATVVTKLNNNTDLQITKTAPQQLQAGLPITYTITVSNNGPGNARGVAIKDTIPAMVLNPSWQAVVAGGATVNSTSGTGNIDLTAGIPVGTGLVTITVTGTVDPSFTGTIVNRAVANPGPGVTDPTPAVAVATTKVTNAANLSIVKSGPAKIAAGTTITYSLIVHNAGPSVATGLKIFDTIPYPVTNTIWTAKVNNGATVSAGSGTGNTINLTANLPVNGTVNIEIIGKVDENFTGIFSNTGIVINGNDSLASNTITTQVLNVNRVSILKSGPDTVTVGSQVAYLMVVSNNGPSGATGQIIDTLPAALKNVIWVANTSGAATITGPTTGSGSPVVINANIPGDGNSTVNILVNGTLDSTFVGSITNFASITEATKTTNSDTVTTVVLGVPQIEIVKMGPDTVSAGASFDYAVTVYNTGTAAINGVRISDMLPGVLTNVLWSAFADGTASIAGGNIINKTGNPDLTVDLPIGAVNRIRIQVSAQTPSSASGSFTNTAFAGSIPSNTVTTVIKQTPGVTISKTGPATALAGNPLTYQLIVGNAGPSDAAGVKVFDRLSDTLQQVSWNAIASGNATIQGGNLQGQTGPVNFTANIPAGDSNKVIVEITGIIDPTFAGIITNQATANNIGSNQVTTTVSRKAVISLTKNGPGSTIAGDKIHYALQVNNAGPSTSDILNILDNVPVDVINVTWSATTIGAATITGPTSGTGNKVNTQAIIPAGIANGVIIQIDGTVIPSDSGNLKNVATVDTAGVVIAQDSVNTILRRVVAITISKGGPSTAVAGTNILYHIRLVNAGLSEAANVSFQDIIPVQIRNIQWQATAGGNSTINGVKQLTGTTAAIIFNADLFTEDDDYVEVDVSGTIDPEFEGTLNNTASYTDVTGKTGNSTILTEVTQQAALTISKIGPATATSGGGIAYTVMVQNNGPSYAHNILITDSLPSAILLSDLAVTTVGQAFVRSRSTGNGRVLKILGDIAPGPDNAIILNITGTVKPETPDTIIRNIATWALNTGATGADSVITHIEHKTDIRVIKSGPATATAGGNIQYSVVVHNLGPSNVSNLLITDLLPAGLINATWTATTQGTGTLVSATSGIGDVNLRATIPAGVATGVTVTINATVDPSFTGNRIVNVAAANHTGIPVIRDSVITTINSITGLQISKTGYNQAVAGGTVKYAIIVTNTGPSTAFNVPIKDILPAGIIGAGWTVTTSGPATASAASGTGNINITANIPVDGAVAISIVGKIDPSFTGATITNTAYADTLSSSQPTAILRLVDLGIVKSGPANTTPGATIAYRLVVTNNGFSDATNAFIEDVMPVQVFNPKAVVRTTGGASVSSNQFVNDVFQATVNIPAVITDSVIVDITGTVDASLMGGSFMNTATVKAEDDQAEINTANNKSSITTAVDTSIGINVSKSGPASVNIGDTIRYTITVANSGTTTATPVLIADMIPAEIQGVSWTASVLGGTGNTTITQAGGTGNNIAFQATIAGSAAGGGTVVINVKGIVTQAAGTTIKNTITATYNGNKVSEITTAVNRSTDLNVTKLAPVSVNAGGAIEFIIVATNRGPADVTGAILEDIVPNSIIRTSWTVTATGGASSSVQSGTGNNVRMLLNIPANTGTVTIRIQGLVMNTASGTIANLVTLDPPAGTIDPTKAVALTNTIVNSTPSSTNISIVKSAPDQVNAGDSITYQLNITNTGNTPVSNLTITDAIPDGISGVSWSATAVSNATVTGGATGTGTAVQVSGQLQINGLITIFIKGRVDTSFQGILTNTAEGTADGKSVSSNTVLTLVNKVIPETDLSIVKSAPSSVNFGDTISYLLTVKNLGPMAANNAIVTDNLLPALKLVDAVVSSTSGGAGNISINTTNNNITATLGTFPANATATIVIRAVPLQLGNISNLAVVATPQGITDVDNSDNFSFVNTLVKGATQLIMKKEVVTPGPYVPGQSVTYKLTVENPGPFTINQVTVTDILPSRNLLGNPVLTDPNASYNSATNQITWNVGTLQAGVSATLEYQAAIIAEGQIENKAIASAPVQSGGLIVAPDSATASISSAVLADLAITKTISAAPATLKVGDKLTFVITVKNQGPNTARTIIVTDALQNKLTLLPGYNVSVGTVQAAGNNITWSIDSLANGESATLQLVARIEATGEVYNEASVFAVTPDPDSTNNYARTPTVTVTGDVIEIPNTITPNGDGKNDHFVIPGIKNYPGSTLLIYNRWGNQVYESKNYANEWDGHNLNEGTYFYILKLNTPQGFKDYKGWVLLIR